MLSMAEDVGASSLFEIESLDMRARVGDRLTVAAIDPQPLVRAGIGLVVSSGGELVAEGRSVEDAQRIAASGGAEIIVIDLPAICSTPSEFTASFVRRHPMLKLVVLSAEERENEVAGVLQSGAHGYVSKFTTGQDLLTALTSVATGEVYVSPVLGARLLTRARIAGPAVIGTSPSPCRSDLSARELQILKQVAVGATNREIARMLGITEKTVKHYMTNIMQKLNVRNRVEAVMAVRDKLDLRLQLVASRS